jgi:hypothetical protein
VCTGNIDQPRTCLRKSRPKRPSARRRQKPGIVLQRLDDILLGGWSGSRRSVHKLSKRSRGVDVGAIGIWPVAVPVLPPKVKVVVNRRSPPVGALTDARKRVKRVTRVLMSIVN